MVPGQAVRLGRAGGPALDAAPAVVAPAAVGDGGALGATKVPLARHARGGPGPFEAVF